MSAPLEKRSPVLRFLDAFFQDSNIKWMLGIGILILLGSSLMLVTAHWDDYTPVWKHLILLGYTAGIHGLGQLAYHSLALRKTGTGLMALTVLLIPLTFLGLHWVHPDSAASWNHLFGQLALTILLTVNTAFSLLAARRIFGHFLRRPQPTFVICYVLLALAGAIVPVLPANLSPAAALVLWSVFAVGAVKVNRHVFWLTEEHRLPRVCGFFPILLLGGMFLTLFAVGLAPNVPLTWIGFGLVMTAIPVLLTADALAGVFQQQHLELPRPLPWGIVLPVLIGLGLTLAGVCLSSIGFPSTTSLPPTAALAAIVLAVTARRSQSTGFVWLMLAAILTAYQTAPVFFQEIARAVVQQGAAAVHEQKLPYAFYGVTYLPLLAVLSCVSTFLRRRDEELFSTPLRQFSIGLGLLLLLISVTHAKAMFPVGLALSGLFGLQFVLFRDRRLLLAGIGAFVLAGAGLQAFVEQVWLMTRVSELPWLAWTITAGLLLYPGRLIDRRTITKSDSNNLWDVAPACQWTSLVIVILAAAAWLGQVVWFHQVPIVSGLACAILLLIHAWHWKHRDVARIAVGNAVLLTAVLAIHAGWILPAVMTLESLILSGLWIVGRRSPAGLPAEGIAEDRVEPTRITSAQMLRSAGTDVALVGLGGIAMLYTLPLISTTILMGADFSAWIVAAVSLAWSVDAAWQRQSARWTVLGWLLALGTVGVVSARALGWGVVYEWYPALAAVVPLFTVWFLPSENGEDEPTGHVLRTLRRCVVATLAVVAIGTLLVFTVPMRVAGVVALVGLLWSASRWQQIGLRTVSLSVASWQGLAAVLQSTSPHLHAIENLRLPLAAASALPLALAAALLSIVWDSNWMKQRTVHEWCHSQRRAFRVVAVGGLLNTLLLHHHGLSIGESLIAATLFVLFTAEQLWTARHLQAARSGETRSAIHRRDEGERHVWIAECIAAIGVGYLLLMGAVTLGGTMSLFAPLVVAALLTCVGRWSQTSDAWSVLSRPFQQTALMLPLLSVVVGILRHATITDPSWLGVNSLALLIAAAFYFWRGLEHRTPVYLIGSAAILNVASVLLWRELTFSDPQFFMIPLGLSILVLVELLKPQIESKYVDPLRYVGALTILVSPTFHIVAGSWLHLLTLMIASVLVTLTAIGLRVRALMYTGTAFLAADVVAMVVRGSVSNTSLLWIAGILVGSAVVGLAAYCEQHREQMLQRLRLLATQLESWE